MQVALTPSQDLKSYSIHFDDLTPAEFDSLRILLYTLIKEQSVLASIPLEAFSLKKLLEQAEAHPGGRIGILSLSPNPLSIE